MCKFDTLISLFVSGCRYARHPTSRPPPRALASFCWSSPDRSPALPVHLAPLLTIVDADAECLGAPEPVAGLLLPMPGSCSIVRSSSRPDTGHQNPRVPGTSLSLSRYSSAHTSHSSRQVWSPSSENPHRVPHHLFQPSSQALCRRPADLQSSTWLLPLPTAQPRHADPAKAGRLMFPIWLVLRIVSLSHLVCLRQIVCRDPSSSARPALCLLVQHSRPRRKNNVARLCPDPNSARPSPAASPQPASRTLLDLPAIWRRPSSDPRREDRPDLHGRCFFFFCFDSCIFRNIQHAISIAGYPAVGDQARSYTPVAAFADSPAHTASHAGEH
ncbi:uncharacterized protein BJ171DRAFT_100614 [Polychytrium aggregatum]|uniref:uncharacterized protein n=1 Tax=Polychytrium aggregatum TaxID=110093 RepID=UPI0022FE9796|nr:uncharacterized protein BJ171DRAFT_100614 [Polychytrium aggregatum]KAI9204746.1 hypothetical protein BJ171DRAFT_100614 [Polychytrium aggregatum]